MSPHRSRTHRAQTVITQGGGGSGPNPTDAFSLGIKASDSNAVPTDASTFAMALLEAESNAAQTETASLNIKNLGDTSAAPTDVLTSKIRVWLSNTTKISADGVGTVANANGANDGLTCDLQSVTAGAANPKIRSDIGTNIGTITFTNCTFTGWYSLQTTVSTSTARVVAHSSSALFADITIETLAAVNGLNNHLTTPFTFDLFAAGVNTLAKVQSLQLVSETIDAVAGVTPAVLKLDAAAADITGVF